MTQKGEYTEVGRKDPSKSRKSPKLERVISVFLKLKDKLNGEQIDLDFVNGLLAEQDMDAEIDTVPIGFMLMISLAAYAQERHDNLYDDIKALYGRLDEELRENIAVRPTDAKVKAAIESHPEYLKSQKRLNRYARQASILKGAAKAYDLKKDMLQTKSANARSLNSLDESRNPSKAYDRINGKNKKSKGKDRNED